MQPFLLQYTWLSKSTRHAVQISLGLGAVAAQPWDPFYQISAADLRQAILEALRNSAVPNLTAIDISRSVWPPPGAGQDVNRSSMKSKV